MKDTAVHHGAVGPKGRLTRAERRAAEREEARHRPARRAGPSLGTIIGIAFTTLAVLAIAVYAAVAITHTTGKHTAAALTNPNALSPAASQLEMNNFAPNFTLKDANGKAYDLRAQRGHPVLLEFFAVWCPVCHAEAPTIARLTKEFSSRGVRVWSVLANPYGQNYEFSGRTDLSLASKSDLTWYAQTYNVHHPQLIDPNFSIVNQYGVRKYPGLLVVNPRGIISYSTSGQRSYKEISQQLRAALAVPAP